MECLVDNYQKRVFKEIINRYLGKLERAPSERWSMAVENNIVPQFPSLGGGNPDNVDINLHHIGI